MIVVILTVVGMSIKGLIQLLVNEECLAEKEID